MTDKTIVIVGNPGIRLPLEGRPGFVDETPVVVADTHYYQRALLDGDIRLASDAEVAELTKQSEAAAEAEKAAAAAAQKPGKKEPK